MVQRNAAGQWLPGESANPNGKPAELKQVRELARQQTEASIQTLAQIRDDRRAPAASRVAAAIALLDRAWGRPEQTVTAEIDHGLVVKIIKFADGVGYVEDALQIEHEPADPTKQH